MKLRSVTAVHTARYACNGEPSLLLSDIVPGLGPVASGFWNVSAHESSHDERKRERVSNEQLSSARKREDDARFATSTPLMACLRHRFRRFRAFKMVETAVETAILAGGNGVETAWKRHPVSTVSTGNGNGEWKRGWKRSGNGAHSLFYRYVSCHVVIIFDLSVFFRATITVHSPCQPACWNFCAFLLLALLITIRSMADVEETSHHEN